ncbi:MAG: alpha/beta hydrolase [Chloroflexota bacterium]
MSITQKIKFLELKSGRQLAIRFLVQGDPGKTVFLCHPSPGAGNLVPNLEETIKRDATLVAVDRAGYGQSDASTHWVSVSEAADDLAEAIQSVATGSVGIAGWSLGGWVALALAARHPELVDRLAVIATPALENEQAWMLSDIREALGLSQSLERNVVNQNLETCFANKLADTLGRTLLQVSGADQQALALPGVSQALTRMLEESFAQGNQGLITEMAGFNLLPWGFEPNAVAAKTLCLYGSKDPVAPQRHGSWWQKRLPDARLEMSPKVGHLLIFQRWKRVLSHLLPRQRKTKK